jgi:hypothetical protein
MANIPGPEVVLQDLSPTVPLLFAALEVGLTAARSYFADGRPSDPYLGSHLARYEAKKYLMDSGVDCAEIANTGLFIRAGKYPIRIFKADEGELPAPGPSLRRQAYYSQMQLQYILPFPEWVAAQIEGPNLIIIWDATSSYTLLNLTLACPEIGRTSKNSVSCYWSAPIPHPATMPQYQVAAASIGDVKELVEDLEEIQLKQSLATKAKDDKKESMSQGSLELKSGLPRRTISGWVFGKESTDVQDTRRRRKARRTLVHNCRAGAGNNSSGPIRAGQASRTEDGSGAVGARRRGVVRAAV